MSITSDPLFIAAEVAYRREVYGVGRPGPGRHRARRGRGSWWRLRPLTRRTRVAGASGPRPA